MKECPCYCHAEFDRVYACSNCVCKSRTKPIPSKYDSYNNCGNCTHNILERLWHWQDHRIRISRKTTSRDCK